MNSLKLVISDEATADLQDIWDFIAEHSLQNTDKFIDKLYQKCKQITRMPEMGRPRDELLLQVTKLPLKAICDFLPL